MHSTTFTSAVAAIAALAVIPAVSAHGYVTGVKAGGKYYPQSGPNWIYQSTKPKCAEWFSKNQDLGFVAPSAYKTDDITCHIDGTPGTTSIPVKAGSTIDLEWSDWPDSHHGPVLDYLAKCENGDCTKVKKNTLKFFKIGQQGLINDNPVPGKWASDKLLANNNTWSTHIPSGISGNYVLRHEIIALHSAGSQDGAQNYPMCINLKITGSGKENPCTSGAKCVPGTGLYTATNPGILVNIYTTLKSYKIPGPALWSKLKKRDVGEVVKVARKFFA